MFDNDLHRVSRQSELRAVDAGQRQHLLDFGNRINEILIMVIDLPEHIEARLTPEAGALNLAVGLYASNEISLGQGARIAKLSISEFMKELGRRKIAMHYGVED